MSDRLIRSPFHIRLDIAFHLLECCPPLLRPQHLEDRKPGNDDIALRIVVVEPQSVQRVPIRQSIVIETPGFDGQIGKNLRSHGVRLVCLRLHRRRDQNKKKATDPK